MLEILRKLICSPDMNGVSYKWRYPKRRSPGALCSFIGTGAAHDIHIGQPCVSFSAPVSSSSLRLSPRAMCKDLSFTLPSSFVSCTIFSDMLCCLLSND